MPDEAPDSDVAAGNEPRQLLDALAPTADIATEAGEAKPVTGIGLCLSGGGYRAMLFHLGAIWRLNDAGLLRGISRISSVSGGSITSACLGMRWRDLEWDSSDRATTFGSLVVEPIRRLASRTIDVKPTLLGALPLVSAGGMTARAYRKALFGDKTLQSLPSDDEGPRFIINATNLQSGVLWRFSKPYMADYTVGLVPNPKELLATAVAASAAFPPLLSPVKLGVDPSRYAPDRGAAPINAGHRARIVLTDGGVYDNMGLETVWKRCRDVLVSDAGGGGGWSSPGAGQNWLRQFWRVFWIQRYQVGRIRRHQLINSYLLPPANPLHRRGAYWGVGGDISNYQLPDAFDADFEKTKRLRDVPTRLQKMPAALQERLINWGFAVCDAAIRKHYNPAGAITRPPALPYPNAGFG